MELKVGMKVQTRDGRSARIVADDCKFGKDDETIIALVEDRESGTESLLYYYADGHYFYSREDDDSDLIVIPDHQHKYFVYADGSCTFFQMRDEKPLAMVVIKVIGNTVTAEVANL